jgi:DNA-binding Xre family transcriptional regulator
MTIAFGLRDDTIKDNTRKEKDHPRKKIILAKTDDSRFLRDVYFKMCVGLCPVVDDRSLSFLGRGAIVLYDTIIRRLIQVSYVIIMGMIRLKIREYASQKGWTLKEVSDRSGVVYSTLRTYARSPGLATVDFTAIQKLARTFDVMIEELVEVVQE